VVLDWMLPDIEGIEVGRRLRERGFQTAILFLTAKDATENKVDALRAGGDDYATKPFSLAEIVARIQAILRRTAGDLPGDVLRFADLVLTSAVMRSFVRTRRSS
jgi:two-component system, OmpR family, response regulator